MNVFLPLLIGWLVLALAMVLTWRRQVRTLNAGVVDVVWTLGLGFLAVLYAATLPGWGPRRILVAGLVSIWSLRLALHLIKRVGSEPEDGRYAKIRKEKGESFDGWAFWFFQAQAFLDVLLSLPFLLLMLAQESGWRTFDLIGVLLFVVALVGESIADRQLAAFRADPANRGRTCRTGLWSWSRHPNYFFEWLHWLVYPVLGIGLPYGWLLWLAPAFMLLLVLKVTGIPPTEQRALESRGDDYRDYQQTTNAFFPGPPRPRVAERGTTS